MDSAKIIIDGKYFAGEDLEREVPSDYGGKGWHVSNHRLVNPLVFTDDPNKAKQIVSKTNIKSTVAKILERVSNGEINPKEIRILFDKVR